MPSPSIINADLMGRKIIDMTDDELIELGYWGDKAIPRVKQIVQAVRNDPQRLGRTTCFELECVKKHNSARPRAQVLAPLTQ